MICGTCGTENPAGAKFCNNCASRLVVVCPSCGTANPPGAKFCSECATPLAGAPPIPAGRAEPANPGTERRLVSVLFADLVGFTTLAADRDPEETRELLAQYFELAREIVARYGGTLEKFIGDAVMAVWGAPTAHEDDAERAVRAALELVDAVPPLGVRAGVALQIRAGVLTGEAAVSIGAVGEGLVAGDLVNTASRLQSVADPGTVLVGDATRIAAEAAIAFEALGEASLKGKPFPVSIHRALRVVADRGGSNRIDVEPPFVGRADELRFLKEQFHATGRDGRAHLVSLVGQAGIGKSRLAWELEKYLDGVVETVWWHRGRSPSYGDGLTFWALGEMIRRRAGLAEGDDQAITRQRVAAMLARHVPAADERRWIEPRVLALLGVEEAPPGGREELFAAWRTLFERIAAEGTVALVFEDLQWADDGLLDFIEHLLDWSGSHPIFVVTLARPELLDRRPGWGTDRRGATAMRLEALSSDAMRGLLHGLVPGLAESVTAAILARADGIPLYAVEIVRMLVADGRLVREGRTYRPAGDLGAVEIPATLHALVAARLDALPAADRALLQDAAVLGQSFTLPALAALTGDEHGGLASRLQNLVRRELLAVESDPRAPTRGQHAFVQSTLREVAYATLPKRLRRARHLAAARYFESLADDELAAALAMHYLEAYRAAPDGPEGEAAAVQARIAVRAAAQRAEAMGALSQAIELQRAAQLTVRDPREEVAAFQEVGRLLWAAGRYDEAEPPLTAAIERTLALGDTIGFVRASALLGVCLLGRMDIRRAIEVLEHARPEAESLTGPEADSALALYFEAFARARFRNEEYGDSVRWADLALPLAERTRLDETVAMALVTKASALNGLGRLREGTALLQGAVLDARAHGQHFAALRGGVNIAAFLSDIDPRQSLAWTKDGIAEAKRLGLSGFFMYQAGNLSTAVRLGEWAESERIAADLLQNGLPAEIARVVEDVRGWIRTWQGLEGPDRALQLLDQARRAGDPQTVVGALEWLAYLAYLDGDYRAAVEHGRELLQHGFGAPSQRMAIARFALHAGDVELARQVLESIGAGPGGAADADIANLRAGIAAREGRRRDALDSYRTAFALYREFGLLLDFALAAIDQLSFLGPDEAAGVVAATEARSTLVELGAVPLVARIDRLLGAAAQRQGVAEISPMLQTAR
jgi:class 3 adenylate cyclase/tetratricopeptide (TPR) repeat protein